MPLTAEQRASLTPEQQQNYDRYNREVTDPKNWLLGNYWGALPAAYRELYRNYVEGANAISSPGMAASPAILVTMILLASTRQPKAILDLGSGISSAFFRYWQKTTGAACTIISADHEEPWLEKSKAFCRTQGLPDSNMMGWNEFTKTNTQKFDFVFFDIDHIPERIEYYKYVVPNLITEGALLVFDDMHYNPLLEGAREVINQHTITILDPLMNATKDHVGRFSALVQIDKFGK